MGSCASIQEYTVLDRPRSNSSIPIPVWESHIPVLDHDFYDNFSIPDAKNGL